MKKNLLAWLLLGAVMSASAGSMIACGDTAETPAAGTQNVQTAAVTEAETEAPRVTADLPARDFGGETLTFYGRIYQGAWSASDILSRTQDGEQINDALYDRTNYIEDTYNVKLDLVESGEVTVTSKVKSAITAGDNSWQALVCDVYDAGSLSVDHMLLDLKSVENLDLSKPWWAQSTNASLTIDNRQFYATGDIFIKDNQATRVFFFNKDMIKNYDLVSPYKLVFDNAWTIEKFMEYNEVVYTDLNGDNVMSRDADQYGTMAQPQFGNVLYIGAGQLLTSKDDKDIPFLSCMSERAISIMTGISEIIGGNPSISCNGDSDINGEYPNNLVYFQDGRVLFAPEVLLHIETMRGCDVDIGILPPPKYDVSQDRYYCYADGWCVNVVSIPVTNTESEKMGFILEAMAADSANNLTPAYYDIALTSKYVRDEESVKMLDLILNSVVMDNANIFTWGSIEDAVSTAIYKGQPIASTLEKKQKATQKAIDKTVSAIESYED
ncbi:MAG: hypothetical protein MJ175_11060 [Clostridia bacterium]|nr:hypothetical protein [Clostridia bacterium]